jgi:hypothetical protein
MTWIIIFKKGTTGIPAEPGAVAVAKSFPEFVPSMRNGKQETCQFGRIPETFLEK